MNTTTEPATSSTMRLVHSADSPVEVVSAWHDETHAGKFWICMEQPCHAVNRYIEDQGLA